VKGSAAQGAIGWIFKFSSRLVGDSLDEMKRKYEDQRDKEFAEHVCAEHLRGANSKG